MSQPLDYRTDATPIERPAFAVVGPVIAIALFLGSFAYFVGWPKWPVIDAGERIAYSALAAGALAIVAALVRHATIRFVINLAAVLVCVVPTMLPMVRPTDWGYGGLALWSLVVAVPVALIASLTQRLRERDPTPLPMLVTLGVAAATGGLLMSTGSLKLGQAGLGLAAGVAIALVVGRVVRSVGRLAGETNGVVTATLAIVTGLLASGHLWSELPLYAGLCVLAGPVLAWVTRVPLIARRPRWQRVVGGLLIAAIPAAVAVGIEGRKAYVASQEEGSDAYGYLTPSFSGRASRLAASGTASRLAGYTGSRLRSS